MPLGNPTPLRQEMYLTSLARSTPGFRIKQFLKQYFLSEYELSAIGYDKLNYRGCTEPGFDGFISKNECLIDGGKVIVVCMVAPRNRVSFGEHITKREEYLACFWCSKSYQKLGSASLNPDCLMMEVSGFPKIDEGYDIYEGKVKPPGAEDYETFVPKYKHLAKELNEIGSVLFAKRKAVCYPVIISKGFELIVQKGLKVSKKE